MRIRRALAFLAAMAIVATACGDDGGGGLTDDRTRDLAAARPPPRPRSAEARSTFGNFSEPASLDPRCRPAAAPPAASRWPRSTTRSCATTRHAASTRAAPPNRSRRNADFTEWTIKLKPASSSPTAPTTTPKQWRSASTGIASARSRPRHATAPKYFACPRNSTSSGVYMALVKDIAGRRRAHGEVHAERTVELVPVRAVRRGRA